MKRQTIFPTIYLAAACLVVACTDSANSPGQQKTKSLNISVIEQASGMKGTAKDGEYKITVPQNDLKVVVDGFQIVPPMGLGSWAAFAPAMDGAMVMGDVVVTENDLKEVQAEVIRQGLTVTAIHNHFVRDTPHVMFMHIGGMGTEEQLGAAVKAIFEKVKEVRGADPASATAESAPNELDTSVLDDYLGTTGEMGRGVYKYTIGRPDVELKDHDAPVSTFLGFNTWAAWQGTMERAAVSGDFAMLENEVAPVIKALVENGIEIVAVHNHMVHENPRIFFLHYWGVGPAEQLAAGLKAALAQTGRKETTNTASLFPGFNKALCN